jgi:hypothetical protein
VLRGETRVLRVERDLLKERLNAFVRKLFASKSEARGRDQKDLFFDEAEALQAETAAAPAQEEPAGDTRTVDVPAHRRTLRGRKPLDPALPRDVVRIELPEGENALRPFVVGRKNWLHSDTVAGAKASANLYSLIETCKANGMDPYRYLCALFAALPTAHTVDDYEALLPWRIALAKH